MITFQQKPSLGVQINWAHSLAKGLVGCWLLNEDSGNMVFDLSKNGLNLTLFNDAHFVLGTFGSALDFDGTGDYAIKAVANFSYSAMSMACWAFTPTAVGGEDCIMHLGKAGQVEWFEIEFTNGDIQIGIDDNGNRGGKGKTTYKTTEGTYANSWHHLVATVEPGVILRLYIDGVEYGAGASLAGGVSEYQFTEGYYLGYMGTGGSSNYFQGLLGNAALFNRTLNANEVTQLCRESFAMFRKPTRMFVTVAGVTVSPDFAAATCAIVSPTVVKGDITISPIAVETVGGIIPPIVIKGSVTITPSVASAAALGIDPTIPISADVIVSPEPAIAATATSHESFEEWTSYGIPFLYASTNWGDAVFYLEVYLRATSGTAGARLYNITDSSIVDDSTVQTTNSSFQRLRSNALTLTDSKVYRVQFGTPAIGGGEALGAKLIAA